MSYDIFKRKRNLRLFSFAYVFDSSLFKYGIIIEPQQYILKEGLKGNLGSPYSTTFSGNGSICIW